MTHVLAINIPEALLKKMKDHMMEYETYSEFIRVAVREKIERIKNEMC